MSIITTSNHPKALWPGVRAFWGRHYDAHPVEYTDLFNMETSKKSREEDVQLTGFGLAPRKAQGGSVSYDTETQGVVSVYTHVAYALGYIVTREERDDTLYVEVSKRRAQANAFSMRQTKEIVAANIYNRATTSGYTYGDGQVLLSASHPSSSGTWSNVLPVSADLSEASLEDLIIQIMTATNDKGLKISLMPQSLHIHPKEWFNANRIMKSALQNDTANNAVNVLKLVNALPKGVQMNHYFTDQDAWFIRTNAPRGMMGYDRAKDALSQDNDFDTDNAKAKSYERYSFGCTDPRGIYGSPGA